MTARQVALLLLRLLDSAKDRAAALDDRDGASHLAELAERAYSKSLIGLPPVEHERSIWVDEIGGES